MAKLIRLIAFSYLIANGDLHAKNVSLRTEPGTGRIGMTPAYDLLSTLPYGDRRMALKLEGRDDNLKRAHFVQLGERHGVRSAATVAILEALCERAKPWLDRLGEIGLEERRATDLRATMRKRREDLGTRSRS